MPAPEPPTPEPVPPPAPVERAPLPERFMVSRSVLRLDRFMTYLIMIGGVGVVAAVLSIFFFIGGVIWPLFQKPRLEILRELPLATSTTTIVGLDERSELPFSYAGGDAVRFHPANTSAPITTPLGLPPDLTLSFWKQDRHGDRVLLGSTDGRVSFFDVNFASTAATSANPRSVIGSVNLAPWLTLSTPDSPAKVLACDYAGQGERKLFGALLQNASGVRLVVIGQRQKKGLLGSGKLETEPAEDLTHLLGAETPRHLLLPATADSLVVLTASNQIVYLYRAPSGWELRQTFRPFDTLTAQVTALDFLYGDVSLIAGDATGKVHLFSLNVPTGSDRRLFIQTQHLHPLAGAVEHIVASRRNKAFVVAGGQQAALCYATTGTVRSLLSLPYSVQGLSLDAKAEHLGIVDTTGMLHLHTVRDPHPEASWRSFFGKVWYEGYTSPKWEWQSTGGTDDFEPKLSLVPLIIGSIKGTVYAMLFAIPIALLAAIYTSQFLTPKAKAIIKPAMEIMASLPSVVLGFLAALWLAPVIETKVPSVLLLLASIPVSALLVGGFWLRLPIAQRHRLPAGFEFWLLAPVMSLLGFIAWQSGPALEQWLFVATLPDGTTLADFRLWWPQFSGLPFDQRNCLVVGFIMGFAVIPVIFTIAEDALSNVPPALTSAAEALGASRWQVVRTIVLPIASAGIFSALMIGLGRAVGETMIVVMATGNTPVMDSLGRLLLGDPAIGNGQFPLAEHWNLFSGMRTLSANIAVELPEAAQGSTHYRTLFLGAFVLFLLTFFLNTLAELLRQRLREKFKLI